MATITRSSQRRRRKKGSEINALTLLLLLLVAGGIAIPAWVQQSIQTYVIPLVFSVVLLVCIAGGWFVISLKRKEPERLRALHLSDVDTMTGGAFEHYVAVLVKTQGYQVSVTKLTGDYGGDIVASKQGRRTIIQAKRYTSPLGVEAIQQAVTAKAYYQATACMVVTNSYFTKQAKELARVNACTLIDRDGLASWIVTFQRKKQE